MRGGELKHAIVIENNVNTPDEYGSESLAWSDFFPTRARIRPRGGSKSFLADRYTSETTHEIMTRYIPNVKTNMRIKFGIRIFEIESIVNEHEANKKLHFICTEKES